MLPEQTILAKPNKKEIDSQIKDIISRGNIVCFTNTLNGIIKHVTEWNQDDMGDLTASYSTGATKYVCPYALEYDITEIQREKPNTI